MSASIKTELTLRASPSRVWRALTDPSQLSQWLMPAEFTAEVGASLSFDAGQWGLIHGEVLELVPERLLRISWRNPPLDTTVTWTLEPLGSGTRLLMEHAGFDLDHPQQAMAHEQMGRGWSGKINGLLTALVDGAAGAAAA